MYLNVLILITLPTYLQGGYRLSPAVFGHMTRMLMGLADGKVALILEVCIPACCRSDVII